MTREERADAMMRDCRRDPDSADGSVIRLLMLAFADAEAAAMRERAAEIAEGHIGAWRDEWGSGFDAACEEIATAIRNLPAAGEVGR